MIGGGGREKEGEQREFLNQLSESVFVNLEELNRSRPSAYAAYPVNCVRNILLDFNMKKLVNMTN
jgi:hypothetical protein